MTSKADQQVIKDEEAAEKAHRETKTEAPKPVAPVPAGGNEPGVPPPSAAQLKKE